MEYHTFHSANKILDLLHLWYQLQAEFLGQLSQTGLAVLKSVVGTLLHCPYEKIPMAFSLDCSVQTCSHLTKLWIFG